MESVFKSYYKNYTIFLLDNCSNDNSVNNILKWLDGGTKSIQTQFPNFITPLEKKPINYQVIEVKDNRLIINSDYHKYKLILIKNNENIGFARGNNLIIRELLKIQSGNEYIYLLNNDTVMQPDTISLLINHLNYTGFLVSNSIIYNYYFPEKIDFAGGKLYPWAKAKYFYTLTNKHYRISEFAHGCALMVKVMCFKQYGILSEKFFHGEEDFEFSWRLKKNNTKISCCFGSVVYHKEGVSINQLFAQKKYKLILSIMNRIIDMKDYYNLLYWKIWKFFVFGYYALLFKRQTSINFSEIFRLTIRINNYCNRYNCIDMNLVEKIRSKIV
jgi:hypothetical protein